MATNTKEGRQDMTNLKTLLVAGALLASFAVSAEAYLSGGCQLHKRRNADGQLVPQPHLEPTHDQAFSIYLNPHLPWNHPNQTYHAGVRSWLLSQPYLVDKLDKTAWSVAYFLDDGTLVGIRASHGPVLLPVRMPRATIPAWNKDDRHYDHDFGYDGGRYEAARLVLNLSLDAVWGYRAPYKPALPCDLVGMRVQLRSSTGRVLGSSTVLRGGALPFTFLEDAGGTRTLRLFADNGRSRCQTEGRAVHFVDVPVSAAQLATRGTRITLHQAWKDQWALRNKASVYADLLCDYEDEDYVESLTAAQVVAEVEALIEEGEIDAEEAEDALQSSATYAFRRASEPFNLLDTVQRTLGLLGGEQAGPQLADLLVSTAQPLTVVFPANPVPALPNGKLDLRADSQLDPTGATVRVTNRVTRVSSSGYSYLASKTTHPTEPVQIVRKVVDLLLTRAHLLNGRELPQDFPLWGHVRGTSVSQITSTYAKDFVSNMGLKRRSTGGYDYVTLDYLYETYNPGTQHESELAVAEGVARAAAGLVVRELVRRGQIRNHGYVVVGVAQTERHWHDTKFFKSYDTGTNLGLNATHKQFGHYALRGSVWREHGGLNPQNVAAALFDLCDTMKEVPDGAGRLVIGNAAPVGRFFHYGPFNTDRAYVKAFNRSTYRYETTKVASWVGDSRRWARDQFANQALDVNRLLLDFESMLRFVAVYTSGPSGGSHMTYSFRDLWQRLPLDAHTTAGWSSVEHAFAQGKTSRQLAESACRLNGIPFDASGQPID
jgi:hypothetical protein